MPRSAPNYKSHYNPLCQTHTRPINSLHKYKRCILPIAAFSLSALSHFSLARTFCIFDDNDSGINRH